jgi:hypothetical protein
VGTYHTFIDANRSAVRALCAAHRSPELDGSGFGMQSRWTEGLELPVPVELPVE